MKSFRFLLISTIIVSGLNSLTATVRAETTSGMFQPTAQVIEKFRDRLRENQNDYISRTILAGFLAKQAAEIGDVEFYRQALTEVDQALSQNPTHPAAQLQRAAILNSLHRFAEARDYLLGLGKEHQNSAGVLAPLFDCELELGLKESAEQRLRDLVPLDPSDPGILARQARLAELNGEIEKAAEYLNKAENIIRRESDFSPELTWFLFRQGELKFYRGDFVGAGKYYSEAEKIAPKDPRVQSHIAELRGAEGNFAEAKKMYESLIKAHATPQLHQALGELLTAENKAESAKMHFEAAAKIYENSVNSGEKVFIHHLVSIYSDSMPNPVRALELAEKDFKERATAATQESFAWALFKNGNVEKARIEIDKALEASKSKNPHILNHAALIYTALGDFSRGGELLKRVVKINPRYNTFHVHR